MANGKNPSGAEGDGENFKNQPAAEGNSEDPPGAEENSDNFDGPLSGEGTMDLSEEGKEVEFYDTCRLWSPDIGGTKAINWVQCDNCRKWSHHTTCVDWAQEAKGESRCAECEQSGDMSLVKLTLWKQDRTWGQASRILMQE